MKLVYSGVAALVLVPSAVGAVGLDRTNQPVDILFEDGNYLQFSVGRIFPDVDGEDLAVVPALAPFAGVGSGDVGENFTQLGAAVKVQLGDRLSFALIAEQPYGVDVAYPGDGGTFDPTTNPPGIDLSLDDGSNALGGTLADVDSLSLTALARYGFGNGFSVHGGLRYTAVEVEVALSGYAYAGLDGYSASFDRDWGLGYVVGGAYERPELGLRVALTYFSKTEHDLETTERLNGVGVGQLPIPGNPFATESTTEIQTPEAINLDLQTGLNDRTLLFAKVRYAWWGDVNVAPAFFDTQVRPEESGDTLTGISDGASYEIGLGRQITERLAASFSLGYEPDHGNVSPLGPTDGQKSVGLGVSYDVTDRFDISGGLRYVDLGNADVQVGPPTTTVAEFEGNDVIGVGLQFGYSF